MVASWPFEPNVSRRSGNLPGNVTTLLNLLCSLGDTVRIDAFLEYLSLGNSFHENDGESIVLAIRLLPKNRATALLHRIVAGNAREVVDACADLLARAVVAPVAFDLKPAAASLVSALPGDPARAVELVPAWRQPRAIESGVVVNVVAALSAIHPTLANAAIDTFLGWPKTYDQDAVLVPASLALARSATTGEAASRLRNACMAHLRTRIAEPLAPPADWRRDARLTCKCKFCAELSQFLAEPTLSTWILKSLQENRHHVQNTIRESRCDVNTETVRKGSPHSLVCTKNQATYERRVRQRKKDLKDLAGLEAHSN
jgi:hypothetical protein